MLLGRRLFFQGVAQLGRVLGLEPSGLWSESKYPDHSGDGVVGSTLVCEASRTGSLPVTPDHWGRRLTAGQLLRKQLIGVQFSTSPPNYNYHYGPLV